MDIAFSSLNACAGGAEGPRPEAEVVALREHIGVVLWETVEATFGEGERPAPPRPPMLSVRLKALKQIAKLYGLGESKKGKRVVPEPVACATPEEIAELVGKWRERERAEGRAGER